MNHVFSYITWMAGNDSYVNPCNVSLKLLQHSGPVFVPHTFCFPLHPPVEPKGRRVSAYKVIEEITFDNTLVCTPPNTQHHGLCQRQMEVREGTGA